MFRYWSLADIPIELLGVLYWGQTGHALVHRKMSANDPKRTSLNPISGCQALCVGPGSNSILTGPHAL